MKMPIYQFGLDDDRFDLGQLPALPEQNPLGPFLLIWHPRSSRRNQQVFNGMLTEWLQIPGVHILVVGGASNACLDEQVVQCLSKQYGSRVHVFPDPVPEHGTDPRLRRRLHTFLANVKARGEVDWRSLAEPAIPPELVALDILCVGFFQGPVAERSFGETLTCARKELNAWFWPALHLVQEGERYFGENQYWARIHREEHAEAATAFRSLCRELMGAPPHLEASEVPAMARRCQLVHDAFQRLWVEGCLEIGQEDDWNRRRSILNHHDLGNSVVTIWANSDRWTSIIDSVAGRRCPRPADCGRVREAFHKWQTLGPQMVEHAKSIFEEYRPFADGEAILAGCRSHGTFCVNARRRLLESQGRFHSWVTAVQEGVAHVTELATMVQKLMAGEDSIQRIDIPEDAIRMLLTQLADAGRQLKVVFSGRGYFNYAQWD